jgi:AcrR family transcriptional regulator
MSWHKTHRKVVFSSSTSTTNLFARDVSSPGPESSSKREAIIDIAAKRFAKQGFHGISMRDIAKANDSSVATLYNHFASKDALMLAIGQRFYPSFLADMGAAADEPSDGLTRLLAMANVAYRHCRQLRNEFLTLSHDVRHVRLTEALAPMIAWRNESVDIWRRVLDEGMADGTIQQSVDPAVIIWIVFYAITGILEDTRSGDYSGLGQSDPIVTLTALVSEGLRPRPA